MTLTLTKFWLTCDQDFTMGLVKNLLKSTQSNVSSMTVLWLRFDRQFLVRVVSVSSKSLTSNTEMLCVCLSFEIYLALYCFARFSISRKIEDLWCSGILVNRTTTQISYWINIINSLFIMASGSKKQISISKSTNITVAYAWCSKHFQFKIIIPLWTPKTLSST